MFKVVIADGLHKEGVAQIKSLAGVSVDLHESISKEDLLGKCADADFLVVRSATKVSAQVMESLPKLKGVIRAGVGIDNVDLQAANSNGVWVWNAPKGNFQSTAEMAMALMFSLARSLPQTTELMRQGQFPKKEFGSKGRQLCDSTLGVFGAGNIGFKLARMARGIGMNVLICDPMYQSGKDFEKVDFAGLLSRSDFISIHTPFLPETKNIFNYKAFQSMKRSAFLVNAARGGIIDEADLVKALEENLIAGVGLDVFEKEPIPASEAVYQKLINDRRVIMSPHLGASTQEAQKEVGLETAQKLGEIGRSMNEANYRAPKPLNLPTKPRLALRME